MEQCAQIPSLLHQLVGMPICDCIWWWLEKGVRGIKIGSSRGSRSERGWSKGRLVGKWEIHLVWGFRGELLELGTWLPGRASAPCIRIPSHPLAPWNCNLFFSLFKRAGTTKKFQLFPNSLSFGFAVLWLPKTKIFVANQSKSSSPLAQTPKNKGRTQSKQTTFLTPLMQITYSPSMALRPQRLTTLVATATITFRETKYNPMQLPTDFLRYCYKKSRQ